MWDNRQQLSESSLFISTLGTIATRVERYATMRTSVDSGMAREFLGGLISSAGKREADDIQLPFKQIIDDLDHALHGHGLLGDHQSALGICLAEFGTESRPLHTVLRRSKADAGMLVNVQDSRQEWVVVPQNQGMVEITKYIPCRFLNFITGESHVDTMVDGFFYLDGEMAGMSVQVLCFAAETVETVGIL